MKTVFLSLFLFFIAFLPYSLPLFFTWIISNKPNNSPPTNRQADRIPQRRINKVKLGRIPLPVEVPEPLRDDVEIIPVEMNRVVFGSEYARPLQNHLYLRTELEFVHLGRSHRTPQSLAHVPGVIEFHRGRCREIGGKYSGDALLVGLEEGEAGGEQEGYVVHARGESGAVRALAVPASRIQFC